MQEVAVHAVNVLSDQIKELWAYNELPNYN